MGAIGEAHTEPEEQITVVLDRGLMNKVERALIEAHPYEVPAYQFVPMLNTLKDYGLGIYGTTDEAPQSGRLCEAREKSTWSQNSAHHQA